MQNRVLGSSCPFCRLKQVLCSTLSIIPSAFDSRPRLCLWGQFCCSLSVLFSTDSWVSSSSICLLHIHCSPPLWVEASGIRCFLASLKFVYVSYFPYCSAVEMFLLYILVSSASVTEYHKLSDFESTSEAESLKNQDAGLCSL